MVIGVAPLNNEAFYVLMKSNATDLTDYTLCELRSWASTKCSTVFEVTGTTGGQLTAHCEDPDDEDAYGRSVGDIAPEMSPDWRFLINQWQLSMNINSGVSDSNASNARVLTEFVLREPSLNTRQPSVAEAMAVYASSALAIGTVETTYRHYWAYEAHQLDPGVYEAFPASVRTQEYTSSYEEDWQCVFYAVLALTFVINVVCLVYLLLRGGLVTDYTEPQNLFALAVNSPPSTALSGSCGAGPNLTEMVVPWRVTYAEGYNHYFFEEAGQSLVTVKKAKTFGAESTTSGMEPLDKGIWNDNYKRLTTRRPSAWL